MSKKREERETGMLLDGIIDAMPVFAKELVAGGVAGGLAKSAVAPLERVKILFQNLEDKPGKVKQGTNSPILFRPEEQNFRAWGCLDPLKRLQQQKGLWVSTGGSPSQCILCEALHYMAYEQYRRWIILSFPGIGRGPILDLVAGSFAGGTAVLFTYPLDLVRTKLAYQIVGSPKRNFQGVVSAEQAYKGIVDCFRKTYKEAGLRGLYRGAAPSLYGIFPYAGLKFYFYEEMKRHVPDNHKKDIMVKLACGSIAGLLGQTFTYPLDVVRRQMQVERLLPSNSAESRGTMETLVMIAQKQGWKQLFSGLSINYLKVVPSVAIGFTVYDIMKSYLRVPSRDEDVIEVVTNKRNSQPSLHSS
ncbi:hypothetical protein Patl1_13436 [Pistacia atlantica]|uniref:Uncharacterized protein n=1 Tax=Pistacia atlantica TaxID=434234 RepID=A0ACC1AX59_9ROSI|nr:hypothetical protein Patl1_13436 [Pistacia atlantica]